MPRYRFCLLGVLLAVMGCGGRGDLTGTVAYQGKLVFSGTVQAVGTDKIPKSAVIKDGRYSLKDLPAGPVQLAVSSPEPAKMKVALRKPSNTPPKVDASKWFPIPEKYAEFDKSELTFDLHRGENTFDLKLD